MRLVPALLIVASAGCAKPDRTAVAKQHALDALVSEWPACAAELKRAPMQIIHERAPIGYGVKDGLKTDPGSFTFVLEPELTFTGRLCSDDRSNCQQGRWSVRGHISAQASYDTSSGYGSMALHLLSVTPAWPIDDKPNAFNVFMGQACTSR